MLKFIVSFALKEDGAVTVDWVILAAGVISLSLAAVGVITDGTENISADVENQLQNQEIQTSFSRDSDV